MTFLYFPRLRGWLSLAIPILCICGLAQAQPSNDLCSNAISLSRNAPANGSTFNATVTGEPTVFCGTSIDTAGVWYRWVGDGSFANINVCDTADFDTKLHVYEGSCNNLSCVDGNDDACDLKSAVGFSSVNGRTYYIYVSGYDNEVGNFAIEIGGNSNVANDACDDALIMSRGDSLLGSLNGATSNDEPTNSCGVSLDGPGVWYRWTGNGDSARFDLCSFATFDTKLHVYEGSCNTLTCVGANDDACQGSLSAVDFSSVNGRTYYAYVSGFDGQVGNFQIRLTQTSVIDSTSPANDLCDNAAIMNNGDTLAGTTRNATSRNDPNNDCGTTIIGPGVWYRWTGDGDSASFDVCRFADFDTKLHIYEGNCNALSCVGSNDDSCGRQSVVAFQSSAGVSYYAYVTGFNGAQGNFTLRLQSDGPIGLGRHQVPDPVGIQVYPTLPGNSLP